MFEHQDALPQHGDGITAYPGKSLPLASSTVSIEYYAASGPNGFRIDENNLFEGFRRGCLSFAQTRHEALVDTIGLQPMVFQFCPKDREPHCAIKLTEPSHTTRRR